MGSNSTGILFMIDMDVARNGIRVPLLHWLMPGVTNPSGTLSIPTTVSPANSVSYAQPNPPAGDFAHRYVFLLFAQPSNFTFPLAFANASSNRVGFDMPRFLSAAQLSSQPLAANFIQVQNASVLATTTFPPLVTAVATGTSTSRSFVLASTAGANVLAKGLGSAGAGVLGLAAMLL